MGRDGQASSRNKQTGRAGPVVTEGISKGRLLKVQPNKADVYWDKQ